MWLGILLNLVVGALAVIAGVFAILEMDRLYNSNEGHACYNDTDYLYKKTCKLIKKIFFNVLFTKNIFKEESKIKNSLSI